MDSLSPALLLCNNLKMVTSLTSRKKAALAISNRLRDLGHSGRGIRMQECATYVKIEVSRTKSKVIAANFCRDRVCPMCQWRRSLKTFAAMSQISELVEQWHPYSPYVLLTLTVRNCEPNRLSDTITEMLQGWDRLTKRRTWKAMCLGYARSLEITYNSEENTFHPHIHALVHLYQDYYVKSYLPTISFGEMWQESMGLNYLPICDIRAVGLYGDKDGSNFTYETGPLHDDTKSVEERIETLGGVLAEISKYMTKSENLMHMPDMSLHHYIAAIKGRRLFSLSGSLKEAARQLKINIDTVDDDDEIELSEVATEALGTICLTWSYGQAAYKILESKVTNVDSGSIKPKKPKKKKAI